MIKREEWLKLLATAIEGKLISLLQAQGYRNIAHSVSVKVRNGEIVINITHPAFEYLDRGVRPFQMKPHDKAVPIKKGYTIIFRKITPQSLQRGRWRHPGIKAHKFIQRAVNDAINQMVKIYGRPE